MNVHFQQKTCHPDSKSVNRIPLRGGGGVESNHQKSYLHTMLRYPIIEQWDVWYFRYRNTHTHKPYQFTQQPIQGDNIRMEVNTENHIKLVLQYHNSEFIHACINQEHCNQVPILKVYYTITAPIFISLSVLWVNYTTHT